MIIKMCIFRFKYKQIKMDKYSKEQEVLLVKFYNSLDEANQRRYAAIEVMKLGHGGKKYIKELLNTSYVRIAKGMSELEEKELDKNDDIRQKGGGSKGKKTLVK